MLLMIQVAFFDLDGVLTLEYKGSIGTCASLCKTYEQLDFEHVIECYRKHFGYLTIADGSFVDHLQEFCTCIETNISIDQLKKALIDVTLNEPMLELVRKLQRKYAVGIITNNASERLRLLEESMKLKEMFDPIVVSGDVHVAKNDGTKKIFQHACEQAGCTSNEAVFIDNQEKNLAIPKSMGMHTYWHDDKINNVEALEKQLREWGVET